MNTLNQNGIESVKKLMKRLRDLEDREQPTLYGEAIRELKIEIEARKSEVVPEPFHTWDGKLITCCDAEGNMEEPLLHCFDKIYEIVCPHILPWYINDAGETVGGESDFKPLTDKELLQIGYNLGRMAEITGWGRAVWDRLKEPVEARDWAFVNLQMGYLSNYATGLCWSSSEL